MHKLLYTFLLFLVVQANTVASPFYPQFVDMQVVKTGSNGYAIVWIEATEDNGINSMPIVDENLYIQLFDNNHNILDTTVYNTFSPSSLFYRSFSAGISGNNIVVAWAGDGVNLVRYNYVTRSKSSVINISITGSDVDLATNSLGQVALAWHDEIIESNDSLAQLYGSYKNQIFLQLVTIDTLNTVGELKKVDAPAFTSDDNYFSTFQKPQVEFHTDNSVAIAWGKETFGKVNTKYYDDGVYFTLLTYQAGKYDNLFFKKIGLFDAIHSYIDISLEVYQGDFLLSFAASSYEVPDHELYMVKVSANGSLLSDIEYVDQDIPDVTNDGSYWPQTSRINTDSPERLLIFWDGGLSGYFRVYDQQLNPLSKYINFACLTAIVSGDQLNCFSYPYNGTVEKGTFSITNLMTTQGTDRAGDSGGGTFSPGLLLILFFSLLFRSQAINSCLNKT